MDSTIVQGSNPAEHVMGSEYERKSQVSPQLAHAITLHPQV